jgi:hypothetical protein
MPSRMTRTSVNCMAGSRNASRKPATARSGDSERATTIENAAGAADVR